MTVITEVIWLATEDFDGNVMEANSDGDGRDMDGNMAMEANFDSNMTGELISMATERN